MPKQAESAPVPAARCKKVLREGFTPASVRHANEREVRRRFGAIHPNFIVHLFLKSKAQPAKPCHSGLERKVLVCYQTITSFHRGACDGAYRSRRSPSQVARPPSPRRRRAIEKHGKGCNSAQYFAAGRIKSDLRAGKPSRSSLARSESPRDSADRVRSGVARLRSGHIR